MPELDKNYLAGLYLDEITLDVMPQEYIDAALEVKLRYDACAPRAGYNCVQDRRVKGGFYYRKAPQGQGVNALPPSKLERAMARSQEQPTQRSGLSFLSKAAIGAGVAIGGLALTGAVVNAGRSSEPYQEPVRQKPAQTSSNTARNVAVGVGAAAATGLSAGMAIANKRPPNTDINEVQPIVEKAESVPATQPQQTSKVRTPEEQAAYEVEQPRAKAFKELVLVNYPAQKRGYELALIAEMKRKQALPEEIEKAKNDLKFKDGEGYVRIDDVKARAGNGIVNKAAREKQSADLQRLYDKLKENGVEDSIEFRRAVDKKKGTPLAESSNQYSIDLGGEKGIVKVGEMRFTRTQAEIEGAIAEKIKSKDAPQSQPPTVPSKPAEPEMEAPKPLNKAAQKPVTPPASKPQTTKEGAIAYLGQNMVRLGRGSADGYVNQSAILGNGVIRTQLGDNKAATLIDEGIAEGRIQVKVAGKNTYIRDVDATPFDKFISEAKGLTDVKDLSKDPRVQDLRDAATYKESRAKDSDKPKAAELRDAIANIQEAQPQKNKIKKGEPNVTSSQNGDPSEPREEGNFSPPVDPPKSKKELAQEESQRLATSFEAMTNVTSTAALRNTKKFPMSDQELFPSKATAEQKSKISAIIEKEIEVLGAETPDGKERIGLYEALLNKKYTPSKSQKQEPPTPEPSKDAPAPSAPMTPPVAPKAPEEKRDPIKDPLVLGGVKTYKMTDLTSGWNSRENMASVEIGDRVLGSMSASGSYKGGIVIDKLVLDRRNGEAVREFSKKYGEENTVTDVHHGAFAFTPEYIKAGKNGEIVLVDQAKSIATPPVTPAPKVVSGAEAAVVSKVSKKEAPPVNEEEGSTSTRIAPKVEDIARIESIYESKMKDAADIGDKMLRDNAIRNAFQDKERAIAALSNPPEPDVAPTAPSSQTSTPANKPVTEKKKKPPAPKPKEEAQIAPPTELERAVKGLQDSIAKTEATVQKLQDNIAKMKSGGNPSSVVTNLLNLSSKTLADLSPEGLISKMENAVTYHNGQVKEKQKELKVLSKKPKDEFAGTTVATIKEMLKSQGISIPKGVTTKAELLKLLPKNDAIATSESYLQGYYEIRDKYRRVS